MDFAHAIINALLVGVIYYTFEHMGWLEGKTKWQRFVVLVPVIFVVTLGLNLVLPLGG